MSIIINGKTLDEYIKEQSEHGEVLENVCGTMHGCRTTMSQVEIFSTISMMSCLMIDSLASSTGRDSRRMIDGYINTVKAYKVQGESKEDEDGKGE